MNSVWKSLKVKYNGDKIHSEVHFDLWDECGLLIVEKDKNLTRKLVLATVFFLNLSWYMYDQFDPHGGILKLGKSLNLVAGGSMGYVKFIFLSWNNKKIHGLIIQLKEIDKKRRLNSNLTNEKICERYFSKHHKLVRFIFFSEMFYMALLLLTTTFPYPKGLVLGDYNGELGTPKYYIIYVMQFFGTYFVDMTFIAADLLVGGMYREIEKELELINCDLCNLTETSNKYGGLIQIIKRYQEMVKVQENMETLFGWYFGSNLAFVFLVIIFICIELAILANYTVEACVQPLTYLILIKTSFFYWCWLGNSLLQKCQDIYDTAFIIYDLDLDDRRICQTLRLFQQMLSHPFIISARPLFQFNYELFITVLQASYKFTTTLKKMSGTDHLK